jgi:hypothetical protein
MIKWIYKPAGNCPVESEGYFGDMYFYFRARYDCITIDFAPSYTDWWADKNIIQYTLKYKRDANYGWYPKWRCILLIYWGCWLYVWNKKILKNNV